MRVLQLTDTHLRSDPVWKLYGFEVRARYERVLEHVRAADPQPDLVLVTGDISHDEGVAVYGPFRTDMQALGVPVLVIPGNHDIPDEFAEAFPGSGPVAHRFEHEAGGWRLLCLNSQIPGAVEGGLGAEQLDRLDATLSAAADTPTLICLHHPVVPVGTPWLDAHRIEDADELLDRLERHPQVQLLLCGHVHHATGVEVSADLRQLTAPATSAPFKAGAPSFALGDEAPGMRWIDLQADGTWGTTVVYIA